MTDKTLVVLAAGMGSRYGGLKQIDPVGPNGEMVIDYSAFDARRAGFEKIVFVIRKDMQAAFRDGIGKAMEQRMDVAYAFQDLYDLPDGFNVPDGREKPWGTGHAVYAARDETNDPFAVINADDFYGQNAFELLARHLDAEPNARVVPTYAMVAYELQRTVSEHGTVARGLCKTDENNMLQDIEEVTNIEVTADGIASQQPDGAFRKHDGKTATSMNCWGFSLDLFDALEIHLARFLKENSGELKEEFYLPKSIGTMITEQEVQVKILPTSDAWFGVTYRDDKPAVEAGIQNLIDAGAYPMKLWER